jgi:hypothetical protein
LGIRLSSTVFSAQARVKAGSRGFSTANRF